MKLNVLLSRGIAALLVSALAAAAETEPRRAIGLGLLTALRAADRLPPARVPGDTWKIAAATKLGLDEAKLKANLAALSGNVAIVRRGHLCATQRGDITTPTKLYSVGKSLTALVCGALSQSATGNSPLLAGAFPVRQAQGSEPVEGQPPTLDTLVDGSDFPTPPRASYSQFMSMTSDYGLTPHAPGRHYAYNNEAVQFYALAMDKQFLGSSGPIAALQTLFWDTLGREDEVKFSGYWSGWGGGFAVSARDCARLGLLVERRGEWNGRRLLPAEFVDALFVHQIRRDATENKSPGQATGTNNKWNQQQFSRDLRDGYSYGFWILHGSKLAPNEAIAAEGRGGNYLIIAPRHELVIAVTNYQIDPPPPRAEHYLDAVLTARTLASSN